MAAWPSWLRVLGEIIRTHGIVAAIAVYLVWQITSSMGQRLERIETELTSHAVSVSSQAAQFGQLVRITRANCLNNAVTAEAINRCNQ